MGEQLQVLLGIVVQSELPGLIRGRNNRRTVFVERLVTVQTGFDDKGFTIDIYTDGALIVNGRGTALKGA